MPEIYLTRRIPQAAIDRLEEVFTVRLNQQDRSVTRQELLGAVTQCDALLCLLTDTIDRAVIDAAPRLKCISNYAVGYNNIDVEYAGSKGIVVCNTPGVLTESTADLTFALILSCARRIVESEAYTRSGCFKGWEPLLMLGQDVHHKTLGLIGLGRIGKAVARRAGGFDMRVLYYDPLATPDSAADNCKQTTLDHLLSEADFISIHVPLTPETRHMIGARELSLMKPTAVLINTSRGPVVDEAALADSLKLGKITAAGLDVYENEPEVHPELLKLSNVILLPHIGSASIATRNAMGMLAAENAIAVVAGKEPPSRVN
jgi:glyoxylate reductase